MKFSSARKVWNINKKIQLPLPFHHSVQFWVKATSSCWVFLVFWKQEDFCNWRSVKVKLKPQNRLHIITKCLLEWVERDGLVQEETSGHTSLSAGVRLAYCKFMTPTYSMSTPQSETDRKTMKHLACTWKAFVGWHEYQIKTAPRKNRTTHDKNYSEEFWESWRTNFLLDINLGFTRARWSSAS